MMMMERPSLRFRLNSLLFPLFALCRNKILRGFSDIFFLSKHMTVLLCFIPHVFLLFVSYKHPTSVLHGPFPPLWHKTDNVTFMRISFKVMVHHQFFISIPRRWSQQFSRVNITRISSSLCIIYSPSSISTRFSRLCLFTKRSFLPFPSSRRWDPPPSTNTHSPGSLL